MADIDEISSEKWRESIIALLKGQSSSSSSKDAAAVEDGSLLTVKKLRKLVMMSLQLDEADKDAKKRFKAAVKELEKSKQLTIDLDGSISFDRSQKRRASKDEKEAKKKRRRKRDDDDDDDNDGAVDFHEEADKEPDANKNDAAKNRPCKGNPLGVTRLFLGNLPFAVDEASLSEFLPKSVTHIKWITDKATGKFYGSAFIEMDSSESAAEAVAMAGSQLMGRPIKVNFAPAREGDVWPPEKKVVSGGGSGTGTHSSTTGGQAGGKGIKALGEKPENCVKLFIGNLSYDIDDDGIRKFFASVDAEMKAVRWLHHDSGDFKGCGFVEFWNTEACQKGATLNGKVLLGRPIRIDWAE